MPTPSCPHQPAVASKGLCSPDLTPAQDNQPSLRRFGLTAALAALLALAAPAGVAAATVQLDAAVSQQTIRGFGGATVFMPTTPLTDGDLDLLFGNGPGQIGLTLLRIRVTDDTAWRAIELSNARGAYRRGAKVMATPWSPPAAMKTNHNIVGGALDPSAYGEYARYLNDFANRLAFDGAPLSIISIQNEPDITVTYESCDWTPAQMLDFCRNHAGAITAARVMAPESFQFRRAISDPLLNDEVATANVDLIGGHIYGAGLAPYPLAASKGKEVWMTEHLDLSTDWAGALATGKEIHDCLATANFNAYLWWYLRRFYGPLGEDSVVTKRGYVMAQFAKFIRPGDVRIDATANPAPSVYVSAYRGSQFVIVAINQGDAAVSQLFSIANVTLASVTPWVTSRTQSLEAGAAIAVSGGTFTATLPAGSVTTFVGEMQTAAPAIVRSPQNHRVSPGSTVVLDVVTTGEFLRYQWSRDGVALSEATEPLFTIRNFSTVDAGRYTVTVTNGGGAVTSVAAALSLATEGEPGRLSNISGRALVGTGDDVLIAGFVIKGNGSKRILVRAAGPALTDTSGLAGVLQDPIIELRAAGSGEVVATNDNWDGALEPMFASLGAFPWTRGSRDAALLVTVPAGGYTAVVRGRDNGTGIALVEVYDADSGTNPVLLNISTRSVVGTGDSLQIGGFVVTGDTARTVVIRSGGPVLRDRFGVTNPVEDPRIELHRHGQVEPIAASEDWSWHLAPHFAEVGALPWVQGSPDAAIVTTLDPGVYSVLVRGHSDAAGVALIEVYAEP